MVSIVVVFVYSHLKPEMLEHDGLMTAVRKLGWAECNLAVNPTVYSSNAILVGWGPFGGDVDMHINSAYHNMNKKALCMSAYMEPVHSEYDVVFYETEHAKRFLEEQGCKSKLVHAFGVDTEYWYNQTKTPKIFDHITVGGWNNWHRYEKCLGLEGFNLAIGGIMRENLQQSMSLMMSLALDGWMVSDEVHPHYLRRLYNMSHKAYLPAEFGQERAVLEARSMGLEIELPGDNPKLDELLNGPIYGVDYYTEQLSKGVKSCL